MKRIFCILLSVAMAGSAVFAQTQEKKAKPATATQNAAATPAAKEKQSKHEGDKAENPSKMKKDGTKDKRFKENKEPKAEGAKPAGPMKKDGTPDKRYKANKETKGEGAKPAGPMKKDGTPDMRHKANKDAAKKDAPKKDAPAAK